MRHPEFEMRYFRSAAAITAVLFFLVLLTSCAGRNLRTEPASVSELSGTYNLILYGCKYPDDITNVAFLDKVGDPYTMEIYAPEFQYKTEYNLPARDAFTRADQFIRCHVNYQQTQIRRILDPEGNVAGYEVRPLYVPFRYGMLDVMIINYTAKDSRIVTYIRLDPRVEEEINNRGGGDRGER